MMRTYVSVVALLVLAFVGGAQATSYTTNFPLTESPISEGGLWVGGSTAGGKE